MRYDVPLHASVCLVNSFSSLPLIPSLAFLSAFSVGVQQESTRTHKTSGSLLLNELFILASYLDNISFIPRVPWMTHLTSLVQLHSRLDWPFFFLFSVTNILYSTDAWNTRRSVEATGQKLSSVKTAHLSNKVKLALCAHTLLNGNQWFKRKQTALGSFQLCWIKAHWCFKCETENLNVILK